MGSSTSTVSPGEGTATGRPVWVTGKKGSVVFIVLCLREPPPHPSELIWYHSLFSIPKVSEGFLSFFLLSPQTYVPTYDNVLPRCYWWSFYLEECKSHSKPKGGPRSSDSNPNVKSTFSVGVFSLLCGLLSPLHGSRMFQEKYGSNALELRCVF